MKKHASTLCALLQLRQVSNRKFCIFIFVFRSVYVFKTENEKMASFKTESVPEKSRNPGLKMTSLRSANLIIPYNDLPHRREIALAVLRHCIMECLQNDACSLYCYSTNITDNVDVFEESKFFNTAVHQSVYQIYILGSKDTFSVKFGVKCGHRNI